MSRRIEKENRADSLLVHRGRRWSLTFVGAVIGLIGSAIALVYGSIASAVGWVDGDTGIRPTGTLFLLSIVPLLVLAAFCLDLIDRQLHPAKPTSVTNREAINKPMFIRGNSLTIRVRGTASKPVGSGVQRTARR